MKGFFGASLAALALATVCVGAAQAGPVEDGNAGLEALQQGDYKRAVTLFTHALASSKLVGDDREFAYSQRGAAYLKQGNYAAATADFQRALKLKPDDADAQAGLEEAQSHADEGPPQRGGGGGGSGGGATSAGGAAQAAQAGMQALNNGDYSAAISQFTRALNSGRLSDDDRELALISRGKAYAGKGQYAEATQDFNKALHLKPDDQEAQDGFAKAIVQVRARTLTPGIDTDTCTRNFSSVGSILSGKTYTGYADYPTLSAFDAFAGTFAALNVYTPVPGNAWQISAVNLDAGSITGSITPGGAGRSITLQVRIEAVGAGSRVTIVESVPGLLPTLDLKGQVCRTLADAPKG